MVNLNSRIMPQEDRQLFREGISDFIKSCVFLFRADCQASGGEGAGIKVCCVGESFVKAGTLGMVCPWTQTVIG